ncbi:nicotinamide riboside transporter PnuC [Nostoc sp. TCL240-02]|uniref:nicotinamide riboside transporter PnuC n=1 Tax=Nostoc sp. TCL240-02 TaxID=2572090 RepID=UPI002670AE60|nr:nicotinamide riboside transporter PnuC [Nostoc sp. TCL240-02]
MFTNQLLDALTTIMSFTAMWLMVQKRIESWYYWLIVDVIGIWLYYVKEVKFIAFLYVTLLLIAINGSISWLKTAKIRD